MKRLGEKLHALRIGRGLTTRQLATMLNVTSGYITHLETGRKIPSSSFVLTLARFFDVPTDKLMKDELELD